MNPVQYERMWARGGRILTILAMTHPTGALVFGASTLVFGSARDPRAEGRSRRCGFSAPVQSPSAVWAIAHGGVATSDVSLSAHTSCGKT
jgi:hypothetical protein